MNIVFLTMNVFTDIEMHNIYSDLMKEFIAHGHKPYIVTPREKKSGEETCLEDFESYALLKVRIGNTSNVSFIEKGISTVLLQSQFMHAISKHLSGIHFDLILYSTPPITLSRVIGELKKTHKAPTYLMLKDIFPQNAVDLKLFHENGLIHKYFRSKEKKLYTYSDYIGCMSPANEKYLLTHNREISGDKVHQLPNCIIPNKISSNVEKRKEILSRYNIPEECTVFMYGGNLGKPQDIPYVVTCMQAVSNLPNSYFIICGFGSDYRLLENYKQSGKSGNLLLVNGLPKKEYDELLGCCDVGLIFLDHRFTIPNFPSRMLSYMEYGIPILAATDVSTDVGQIAEKEGFGLWCESNDTEQFARICQRLVDLPEERRKIGQVGRAYLETHYSSETAYDIIRKAIQWQE